VATVVPVHDIATLKSCWTVHCTKEANTHTNWHLWCRDCKRL